MLQTSYKTGHLRLTGILFILSALGILFPYTVLTYIFDYPDILREDPGLILERFYEGGDRLILTWWLFATLGLPLLIAYSQLGKALEKFSMSVNWISIIGIIGLIAQLIGLLRWTFVIPIIAQNYVTGSDSSKEISKASFQLIHQFGGVILGEHIGQLFTISWIIGITIILQKWKLAPKLMLGLGYFSSMIYLLAQAEVFATVIPGFPVWQSAGFVGSTLWLIWVVYLGVHLIRSNKSF